MAENTATVTQDRTKVLIVILYQAVCFVKAQMEQHLGCGKKKAT